MSLYGSLCLVWRHTHNAYPLAVNIKGLESSCSLFLFFIHCSCMPSQELLYAFRNCLSCKLEQILTIYNSSKHSLLNNLYNSVEAVVISITSSTFFIQCTGLTMMWIPCLAVRREFYPQPTSLPVTIQLRRDDKEYTFNPPDTHPSWWWDQV